MALIIFCIIVILIVALLIWAVGYLDMIPQPLRNILIVLIILVAVAAIANRAGLL